MTPAKSKPTTGRQYPPNQRRTRSVKLLNSTWSELERLAADDRRPWTNYLENLILQDAERIKEKERN